MFTGSISNFGNSLFQCIMMLFSARWKQSCSDRDKRKMESSLLDHAKQCQVPCIFQSNRTYPTWRRDSSRWTSQQTKRCFSGGTLNNSIGSDSADHFNLILTQAWNVLIVDLFSYLQNLISDGEHVLCSFVNKERQGHLFSVDSKLEGSFHLFLCQMTEWCVDLFRRCSNIYLT